MLENLIVRNGVTKPCIAAVEGYALGGGFELALMCDLIIASSAAEFGLTEVRLGMLPGGGGTQTLARVIGRAAAKEMVWTGGRISGERAAELGIVTTLTAGQRSPAHASWPRKSLIMHHCLSCSPRR